MTMKGVTIIRHPDKLIPGDYLAKAASENPSAFGSAIARADGKGTKLIVRHKSDKPTPGHEADVFQKHDGIKNMLLVLHFTGSTNPIAAEDVQPFVLLQNDDDSAAMVAFLDGDFSLYAGDASHSDEYHCVTKELMPRIGKLCELTDGNLDKMMDFLAEESTANDWANFMLGKRGSITLLCSNGRIQTITVADDQTQKQFDGWWTSNTYGWEYAKNAQTPTARPKLKLPGLVSGPKVAVASTTPVTQPALAPVGQPDKVPDHPAENKPGNGGVPLTNLGDPDAKLTISVPPGMDSKKLYKWWSKRVPEGMGVPKVLDGLKTITCLRSEATPAFLHSYIEQNKLGGLGGLAVLKNGTALPSIEPKKTEVSSVSQKKKAMPLVAQAKKQGVYPPKAEAAPAVDPAKTPQPEVQQPVETSPQVVDEPLPVFSPDQKANLLHFVQTIKPALDKNLQAIASPQGLAEFEKRVETFAAQFGGKASLDDVPAYPFAELRNWVNENYGAATKLILLLATERLGMSRMLDELTKPVRTQEAAPQAAPAPAPAQTRKAAFPAMPRRKAG